MKKKAEKKKQPRSFARSWRTVSTVILSTFQGITVERTRKLRRSVEAAGGHYQVVKNTVAERARRRHADRGPAQGPQGHEFDRLHEDRSGGAREDPHESREGCSGVSVSRRMGGRARHFDSGNRQLALLPSKEELISKIMFMLNAPAQRVATVLAAVPRNLAVVTSEAVKANKFGGAGGNAPAPETA
jgi:large subunit ribosomal protein L10